MIGIYKITSPSGRVYIGSSKDIENRMKFYKNMWNSSQIRIYNSIKKYGWENHSWEILEETTEENLIERERHYQEEYKVLSDNGLNCKLVSTENTRGKLSIDSINKMKNKLTGRKLSKEHIENIKKSNSKPKSKKGKENIKEGIRKRFRREKGDLLAIDANGNIIERFYSKWEVDTDLYNPNCIINAIAAKKPYKGLRWGWEKGKNFIS